MARKTNSFIFLIAIVALIVFVMGNEGVRESLGPLGDFWAANSKIASGVLIAAVVILFFVKQKVQPGQTTSAETEGTVCRIEKETITGSDDIRGYKQGQRVEIPIIEYRVDSGRYEKEDEDRSGQLISVGDKYTVRYSLKDPSDAIVILKARTGHSASYTLVKDILTKKKE